MNEVYSSYVMVVGWSINVFILSTTMCSEWSDLNASLMCLGCAPCALGWSQVHQGAC